MKAHKIEPTAMIEWLLSCMQSSKELQKPLLNAILALKGSPERLADGRQNVLIPEIFIHKL